MKIIRKDKTYLQHYTVFTGKKYTYKWTRQVPTCVFQGSIDYKSMLMIKTKLSMHLNLDTRYSLIKPIKLYLHLEGVFKSKYRK